MDINEAKSLKTGDTVYHTVKTNQNGTPMRARVTSIKTWKTRPDEVRVRVKRGMYDFAEFREWELDQIRR